MNQITPFARVFWARCRSSIAKRGRANGGTAVRRSVAEIARLETFRNKVHAGAGGLLLLTGPAGIGKSALMAALRERASSHRTAGLDSSKFSATPHVGQENAYGPFLDLFIQVHGTRARRWLRAAGDTTPTLLEGIPGASPLKAGAVAVQNAMSSAPGEGSSLHARTISQRVLATLKRRASVILVIEDAHQLDASSCAVISCMRQTIAQRPVGIVLVCRIEELARNDAASDLVSKLYSSGELDHIRLPGLPKPAIAEYVAVRTGVDPSPPEVDELARRTGGQVDSLPFFITTSRVSRRPSRLSQQGVGTHLVVDTRTCLGGFLARLGSSSRLGFAAWTQATSCS